MTSPNYASPAPLGAQITSALGPDYILLPPLPDDYKKAYVRIQTPEGGIFEIAPACYARSKHFRVFGDYPSSQLHGRLVYSSDGAPEINVSVQKSPAAIASDIKRRFLPAFLPVWTFVQQRLAATEEAQASKTELYRRLCAASGQKPEALERFGSNDFAIHLNGVAQGIVYGSCTVGGGDRVKFDLSTNAATALKILESLLPQT